MKSINNHLLINHYLMAKNKILLKLLMEREYQSQSIETWVLETNILLKQTVKNK
jgi:hypothetical protein